MRGNVPQTVSRHATPDSGEAHDSVCVAPDAFTGDDPSAPGVGSASCKSRCRFAPKGVCRGARP